MFLCIFPCLYIILALPNIVIKELSCGILFHHVSGNTAMVYHDGRVLALNEADKPCKIFEFSFSALHKREELNLLLLEIKFNLPCRCYKSFGGWRPSNNWAYGLRKAVNTSIHGPPKSRSSYRYFVEEYHEVLIVTSAWTRHSIRSHWRYIWVLPWECKLWFYHVSH